MDNTPVILVGGLGAAILWGISDYLAARSAKNVGPILASIVVNTIGAFIFIAAFFIFLRNGEMTFDAVGIWLSVIAGIILSMGGVAFFKGLNKGPVSIVSPLSSLYPLVTTVSAILIFGAYLSGSQLFGIFLIIVGILAASGLLNIEKSERKIGIGPRYGLLAALLWGIGYTLLAQGIARLGWQLASVIEFIFVALTFSILVPLVRDKEIINLKTIKNAIRNKYVIGAGILQILAVFFINYGISVETNSGAVVIALSACYPILTVFLALKHMKEKVVVIPLAGAFVGIAGVAILTLLS